MLTCFCKLHTKCNAHYICSSRWIYKNNVFLTATMIAQVVCSVCHLKASAETWHTRQYLHTHAFLVNWSLWNIMFIKCQVCRFQACMFFQKKGREQQNAALTAVALHSWVATVRCSVRCSSEKNPSPHRWQLKKPSFRARHSSDCKAQSISKHSNRQCWQTQFSLW